jgi:hypothetical protein
MFEVRLSAFDSRRQRIPLRLFTDRTDDLPPLRKGKCLHAAENWGGVVGRGWVTLRSMLYAFLLLVIAGLVINNWFLRTHRLKVRWVRAVKVYKPFSDYLAHVKDRFHIKLEGANHEIELLDPSFDLHRQLEWLCSSGSSAELVELPESKSS